MTANSPLEYQLRDHGRAAVTALFLLPATLLSACKDEPKVIVKTEVSRQNAPEAAEVNVSVDGVAMGAGSFDAKTDLPSFAPIYPGAVVKSQIGRPTPDGIKGSFITLETPDPVEKVAAFYDARAKDAGIGPSMIVNEVDSAVRIFGGKDGADRGGGAVIAITRSEETDVTEIVITAGLATGEMHAMDEPKAAHRPAARDIRLQ